TLVMAAGLVACSDTDTTDTTDATDASTNSATGANPAAATSAPTASATSDDAAQWMSYGRDYSEQRFSPLTQITPDTINELGLAWYGDLAEKGGSYETTPVVVDGRIYI